VDGVAPEEWKLYPLNYGEALSIDKPVFVLQKGFGEKLKAPYTGWLLDNGEEKIVVDAGAWEPATTKKYHHYDVVGTGSEAVEKAIAARGLTPDAVGVVLLTHLHWDHVVNVDLFTNATFYVQEEEVSYALNPLPTHRLAYEVGLGFQPPWHKVLHRMKLLNGDVEVRPGLTCCLLPGHTPGSQGFLVNTSAGKYLIAGDTVDLRENWEGDEQFRHRPGGIYVDLRAYWDTLTRMEGLADVVLPSHDYSIFDQEEYP
jgi:N-acyl homoserine lactone hydrolase